MTSPRLHNIGLFCIALLVLGGQTVYAGWVLVETKRVRLLAFTEFSGHMGTGIAANGYVDQDAWLPVEPESINHALWELVCTR